MNQPNEIEAVLPATLLVGTRSERIGEQL